MREFEDDGEQTTKSPYSYYEFNEKTGEYEFHSKDWDTVDEVLEQMWLERWERENENQN